MQNFPALLNQIKDFSRAHADLPHSSLSDIWAYQLSPAVLDVQETGIASTNLSPLSFAQDDLPPSKESALLH